MQITGTMSAQTERREREGKRETKHRAAKSTEKRRKKKSCMKIVALLNNYLRESDERIEHSHSKVIHAIRLCAFSF